ncbi:hypothetical protein [Phaeobacter sp. C3_T13_0]|uniref:hypothetical protein n=1 Tax=Phaeobacter cretensis TaxID=3342641 RepID=UPI0039BD63A4
MTVFRWDRGQGRLARQGAMLSDLEFYLEDGRVIRPLHTAPWLGKDLPAATPPILKHLQGEWPCVPFGMTPSSPPGSELSHSQAPQCEWPHGYGANHGWTITQNQPDGAEAQIYYPFNDAVKRLSRWVKGVPLSPGVDIGLQIEMRKEANLPIGLHPVLRLPEVPGQARLVLGAYDQAYSYPGDTGGTPVSTDPAPFRIADRMLQLPYETPSETILLLSGAEGHATLENLTEAYKVRVDWDAAVFPSLMLWISNRGRTGPPWNGRHLALGVEPVCSAFDFGSAISAAHNPLNRAGIRTATRLVPECSFSTRYRISVETL